MILSKIWGKKLVNKNYISFKCILIGYYYSVASMQITIKKQKLIYLVYLSYGLST